MDMDPSKYIEAFLSFLTDASQQYRMSEADEQEANDQTQDVLHSLEFEPYEYHDLAKISRWMKSVRQRRRAAKDNMEQLSPIVQWVDENQAVIKGLERLLGEVRKAEKRVSGRIYTPRTDWKEDAGLV